MTITMTTSLLVSGVIIATTCGVAGVDKDNLASWQLYEPRIFYPSGHWPETVTNAHVSAHFR